MIQDGYIIITHILWRRDAVGVDIKELGKTNKVKIVIKSAAGVLKYPNVLKVDLAGAQLKYKVEIINTNRRGFFIPLDDIYLYRTDEIHDGTWRKQ